MQEKLFFKHRSKCINSVVQWTLLLCFVVLYSPKALAQLDVEVLPPKLTGKKAVIKFTMTNSFKEKIESARAAVFLLDENGSMIGQGSRWVIGGTKDLPALDPGKKTTFNFVVQARQPFTTTNLTANISFTRIVLSGGQQIDPSKNVRIFDKKGLNK
jgi:hypothetical protein